MSRPTRFLLRILAVLIAVIAMVACRAAEPRLGQRFDMIRVGTSGRLATSGTASVRTMVSTDSDLSVLRDQLSASIGLAINLHDNIVWSFDGQTEEFAPTGTGLHVPSTRTPAGPVLVDGVVALAAEVRAFSRIGVLSSLLGAGGPVDPSCPDTGPPDATLFREARLDLIPGATEIGWVANPMIAACAAHADAASCGSDRSNNCTFVASACATTSIGPALRIHTRYDARFDEEYVLYPFVDIHGGTVEYDHLITLRPCAGEHCTGAGTVWTSDGTAGASSYRSVLADGLGADATLANSALAFDHTVQFVRSDVGATYRPECPFSLAAVGAGPLETLAEYLHNKYFGDPNNQDLDDLSNAIHFAAIDLSNLVVTTPLCDAVHRAFDRRVKDSVRCGARTFDQVGDLLVNPPSFRANAEQVLIAAGFDSPAAGGDANGQIDCREATAGLMALAPTLTPAAADALAGAIVCGATTCGPTTGPSCRTVATPPIRSIEVALVAAGSIQAGDGAPGDATALPIGEAVVSPPVPVAGAFTDRTMLAIRRGTLRTGTPPRGDITFTGASVDLRTVRAMCENIRPLPAGFAAICLACSVTNPPTQLCTGHRLAEFANFGSDDAPVRSIDIAAGRVAPFFIEPSPGIAHILEVAPLFAQSLRRLFTNAMLPGARVLTATLGTAAAPASPGSATLTFIVDPDEDGIDSDIDNCPATFNPRVGPAGGGAPRQPDNDNDGIGDQCDGCPGLAGGSRDVHGWDANGDGVPNDCDCDIDGDGCTNPNEVPRAFAADTGEIFTCFVTAGRVSDRVPGRFGVENFDGTPPIDDCDADNDDDTVPDATDNCPFGNAGSREDPTTTALPHGTFSASIDRNAAQTNSGGRPAEGDLCDDLCEHPGDTLCNIQTISQASSPFIAGLIPALRHVLPTAPVCLSCSPFLFMDCGARSLGECKGQPTSFLALTSLGAVAQSYGFGLNNKIGGNAFSSGPPPAVPVAAANAFPPRVAVSGLADFDGDGVDEVLVADASVAGACTTSCVPGTGIALIVSGASGLPLDVIDFGQAGSKLGAAVSYDQGLLAVGAPLAQNSRGEITGAVHLFDLSGGSLVFLRTVYGEARDDRFGAILAPVRTRHGRPQVIVGAPNGSGAAGARVGAAYRVDPVRGTVARYSGTIAGGGLTSIAAVRSGGRGELSVVLAAADARSGGGALYFTTGQGRRLVTFTGHAGDHLGASLAWWTPPQGEITFLAGAPGLEAGRGGVRRYTAEGHFVETLIGLGTSFGGALGVGGDLNRDGHADLLIGYDDEGIASTLPVYDLRVGHEGHDEHGLHGDR